MIPYYQNDYCTIHNGECLTVMNAMPADSVDAIVTDPPYGLSFMGKKWDYDVPAVEVWIACLRVLKPGGHLLSFAGTRTQHRMCVNIEDGGFEIRDMIAWVYGSGFPKSLNVGKAIDKAAGVEFASKPASGVGFMNSDKDGYNTTLNQLEKVGESTPEAEQWDGWGTALKPALEPITVARKPLSEKTVAANVLRWGTGAINVDGCRLAGKSQGGGERSDFERPDQKGRWPANLIHDGDQEVLDQFPEIKSRGHFPKNTGGIGTDSEIYGKADGRDQEEKWTDSGTAARFFYCAKASKKDRNEGLDDAPDAVLARSNQAKADAERGNTIDQGSGQFNKARVVKNNHPTVKPTDLMRYLVRLVTQPDGTVLDPFMGSGSTGKAALLEGLRFLGIEFDENYCEIAAKRLAQEVLPL